MAAAERRPGAPRKSSSQYAPGQVNEPLSRAIERTGTEHRIGVLFVHGMGEQQRGDTLTEAGDALVEWLERWCERAPRGTRLDEGDVRILDTALRTQHPEDLAAAHLTVRLTLPLSTPEPDGTKTRVIDWVLAESWWAESFREASFNQVVGWVLGIGPWVLATQFHGIHDRMHMPGDSSPWLRLALWPAAVLTVAALVVVAIGVSALLTVLAIAVLLLRLVPIGPVQSIAAGVQRSLASSFGDLMVLVKSPTRFAAMRSQVQRDLRALSENCDDLVVIAHSQGSQVAWEAVRRPYPGVDRVPRNLLRLITYGQAMRKLRLAYLVSRYELEGGVALVAAVSIAAQLTVLGLLAAVGSAVVFEGGLLRAVGGWFTSWSGVDGLFLLAPILAVILAGYAVLLERSRREMTEVERKLIKDVRDATVGRSAFRWLDLWSSADPAPNGPLLRQLPANIESWRIRNAGSIVLDHSVYWQNLTEFVGAVAFELGRLVPGTAHFPDDSDPFPGRRLRLAALTRSARIQVLTALRIAWIGGALAGGTRAFPELRRWLRFDWIPADIPLLDLLRAWLPTLVALAIIVIAALAGWIVIHKAWGSAIRSDDRAYFRGRIEGPFPWPSWGGFVLLVLVLAGFAGGLLLTGDGSLAMPYVLAVVATTLAALTFLSTGGRGFADPDEARHRVAGRALVAASVAVSILLVGFVWFFHRDEVPVTLGMVDLVAFLIVLLPMAISLVVSLRRFLSAHEGIRREFRVGPTSTTRRRVASRS